MGKTDKERLEKACDKWWDLRARKEFGPPSEERFVGIVVSSRSVPSFLRSQDEEAFTTEAEVLLERERSAGFKAEIHMAEERPKTEAFLAKRAITDLVFIGHGDLSTLQLGDDSDLNWFHLFRSLDHLKQGTVTQRSCGGAWNKLSVALGTFAVSDMRNVFAPVNHDFEPESIDDMDYLLRQVYPVPAISYGGLLGYSRSFIAERRALTDMHLSESLSDPLPITTIYPLE